MKTAFEIQTLTGSLWTDIVALRADDAAAVATLTAEKAAVQKELDELKAIIAAAKDLKEVQDAATKTAKEKEIAAAEAELVTVITKKADLEKKIADLQAALPSARA